jgi:large subunit ribosomal protein L21
VLLVGGETTRVGDPTVAGARVRGSVGEPARGKKIVRYTYKKRQNANRRRGAHRQNYSTVTIEAIDS